MPIRFSFALLALALQAPNELTAERRALLGDYDAFLESPGGDLAFKLAVVAPKDGSKLRVEIRNADELILVPESTFGGRLVRLAFPHYDSVIEAEVVDEQARKWKGTWRKRSGADRWTQMPFRTQRADANCSMPGPNYAYWSTPATLPERWRVAFKSDDSRAVAILERGDGMPHVLGRLRGTFLTTTGDYRYLSGRWNRFPATSTEPRLELSCFDGAHAFLFAARLQKDGSLSGDFWSGTSWHDTWKAVPSPDARLPDPFGLTKWNEKLDLATLRFPDVEGRLRSPGDAEFDGRARLLVVFGTWCPNCHDEAPFLVELQKRYGERGLSVIGLAFEHSGEFARDAEQVKRFSARHRINYPILVAGLSDKEKASQAFPLLDRVRSFPTTIFVDRLGRVTAVHQGFSGPATGKEHDQLREDFRRRIEGLLGRPGER